MNNSLTKSPFIPAWAGQYKNCFFFIYNGGSMSPTFKPGDFLCVQNVAFEDIHVGDVVIIQWGVNSGRLEYVVHRVISFRQEHLITQGDNNYDPDAQLLTNGNLVGRVTWVERQKQIYLVKEGYWGLAYARLIHCRNHIWLFIRRLGWRVYRLVRQSGVVSRIWKPSICQLHLTTENGPLIKFCYSGHTIAHWWPEKRYFNARKPFDLVIPNPEDTK